MEFTDHALYTYIVYMILRHYSVCYHLYVIRYILLVDSVFSVVIIFKNLEER